MKRFSDEIAKIPETIRTAQSVDINDIKEFLEYEKHLMTIGSGGSFPVANFAAKICQSSERICFAATPLYALDMCGKFEGNKLFITAGGKHPDILNFYKKFGHDIKTFILTNSSSSPLTELADKFSFHLPTYKLPQKDGFIAVHSTIFNMGLIWRAVKNTKIPEWNIYERQPPKNPGEIFLVYDPMLETAALDMQSKVLEGSICPIMLCDIRNFAHGLFHYVYRRSHYTTVIFLCTKRYKDVVENMVETMNLESAEIVLCEDGIGANFDAINRLSVFVDSYSVATNIDILQPKLPPYAHKLHYEINV